MRILIHGATTFVKPKAACALAIGNMRSLTKKGGTRDLTDRQLRALRDALNKYISRCSGGASALAELMNVDQSGFGRFLNGKQGSSWGVAFRAAAMMGMTVDELFGAAKEDLAFAEIDDEMAKEAARLALIDGVPRAQITARYQGAVARGRSGFKVNDWYGLLSGPLDPDKLSKADPDPKKPRQKKS